MPYRPVTWKWSTAVGIRDDNTAGKKDQKVNKHVETGNGGGGKSEACHNYMKRHSTLYRTWGY